MLNPLLIATRGYVKTVLINTLSIASGASCGTPSVVEGHIEIVPNSIVTQELFGHTRVLDVQLINPIFNMLGDAVGGPTILTGAVDLLPTSVGSSEFMGLNSAVSVGSAFINPVAIRKLLQFGRPTIQDGVSLTIPQSSRATYQSMAVYLRSTGRFLSVSSNGLIMEWLVSEGIEENQFNNMLFDYWESRGFEGSYNDKWLAWIRS